MKIEEKDILLRIFISESEMYKGKPLYEKIIKEAYNLDLAGATLLKGMMGFGADKKIHSSKILTLSCSLPVVIEIVDRPENIRKIMPFLDEIITDGFVTTEYVNVIRYKKQKSDEPV